MQKVADHDDIEAVRCRRLGLHVTPQRLNRQTLAPGLATQTFQPDRGDVPGMSLKPGPGHEQRTASQTTGQIQGDAAVRQQVGMVDQASGGLGSFGGFRVTAIPLGGRRGDFIQTSRQGFVFQTARGA